MGRIDDIIEIIQEMESQESTDLEIDTKLLEDGYSQAEIDLADDIMFEIARTNSLLKK